MTFDPIFWMGKRSPGVKPEQFIDFINNNYSQFNHSTNLIESHGTNDYTLS